MGKHKEVWSTSSRNELVWKYMCILPLGALLAAVYDIYQVRHHPLIAPNIYTDSVQSVLIIFISALLINLVKVKLISWCTPLIQDHFIDKIKYGNDKEVIATRSHNLAKFCFGIPYYLSMSIWGTYCIWNQDYLVPVLGGQKGFSAILNGMGHYPSLEVETIQRGVQWYYLIQIGYRVEVTLYLLYKHCEPKFYEYLLHHLLAVYLTVFSYETGLLPMGIQIMICHDFSDFVVQSARLYNDYHSKQHLVEVVITLGSTLTWFMYRVNDLFMALYFLITWLSSAQPAPLDPQYYDTAYPLIIKNCMQLTPLWIMDAFWLFQFFKVIHQKVVHRSNVYEGQKQKKKQ